MKTISRAEAKRNDWTRYFTGLPCVNGHIASRKTINGVCSKCYLNQAKRRRDKDPTILIRRNQRFRLRNPDYEKQRVRLRPEIYLYRSAKTRAKAIEIICSILPKDIVIPSVCPILGIPLIIGGKDGFSTDNSPTLDRIIPAKGYVVGNVAVISRLANTLKGAASAEQHRRIADWMDTFR